MTILRLLSFSNAACNIKQTLSVFKKYKPTYCVHSAGYNGNIQFNQTYPADIFANTAQMGLNILKSCQINGVQKVVSLVSSCAYPSTNDIMKEENFWNGKPDNSVNAHGFSKRILLEYGIQLYKQYKLNNVCMICNTAYGPYDSYDLDKTKVVGAVIKKIVDAKMNHLNTVTFWGDGSPRRELIYCEDVAKCCEQVLFHYNDSLLPINVGTGIDISIHDLVILISNIVNYNGGIIWDTSKINGQHRKLLDVSKMKKCFSIDFTPIYQGLQQTIEWYKNNLVGLNNEQ